jgi:polysaccharide chain length determinant protein (PEP-CTERM system associated)
MFGHRELSFDDYLSILRRRIWVLVIPALVAPVLTCLVTLFLPSLYTSNARVLIEQPQVSPDMVRPIVTQRLDVRLALMEQQVLSRARLEPIIQRYGLYKELGSKSPQEMVAKMRSRIEVGLVTTENNGRTEISGFKLNFTGDSPQQAQQVCAEVTGLFLEENLHQREQTAVGTIEFLKRQQQEAKKKLDEQDAKLAEFKSKYLGQLPGREDANLSAVMNLNNQTEALTESVYRAQQDKNYAETLLAQQITAYESHKGGNNPVSLEQQLASQQDQLVVLEGRYTPNHPDIIKAKHDIEQLKKKIEEARASQANNPNDLTNDNPALDPPAIQQLRYQIHQYDETIKAKTREQERLQRQLAMYQGRLNVSPAIEEQYKQLTRDYQTALSSYNDLLAKKTQSEISTDLERRQQGEQFRLIDPPNYPDKPSYPDRLKFALGGFGGGLAFGFGIALLVEMRDKSLRTEKDIEFYLETPALGVVPRIGVQPSNGHAAKRFWQRAPKKPFADQPAATGKWDS